MKKFLLLCLMSGLMFAQTTLNVNPPMMTVTYDKNVDTIKTLATVTVTAGDQPFFFTASVPTPWNGMMTITPSLSYLVPGAKQEIALTLNAQSVPLGTYLIPVMFNSLPAAGQTIGLTTGINLTVVDSKVYVTPTDSDRVVPHLAAGNGWKTELKLVNTSLSTSVVHLKLFNPMGIGQYLLVNNVMMKENPAIAIGPNGSANLTIDSSTGLQTGYATITPVIGSQVQVQATFTNPVFSSSVLVGSATNSTFWMPYNSTTARATGVALVNMTNQDQTLVLDFYDDYGIEIVSKNQPLISMGQMSFVLDTMFPEMKGKSGVVKVTAPKPTITGFGLTFNLENGSFYTNPVMK